MLLDGELIAWDTAAGRLDFAGLQARMTAGRRLADATARRPAPGARRPAQLVCFDVLAVGSADLRSRPLAGRRGELERLLAGAGSPIVLCQQTADAAVASEWLRTLTAGGLEGVVIKDARRPYPIRSGQRAWRVDCTNGVADGDSVARSDRVATWMMSSGACAVEA